MQPTEEQCTAVERFQTGRPLKITAFAGAGKTTTLRLLAESRPSRGAYLAFNKSIATEAQEKFPRTVDCRTTHSIAFRAIMPTYESPPKLTRAILAKQLAAVMGLNTQVFGGAIRLDGIHQAHLVLGTVRAFCHSADPTLTPGHVPTYGRLLGAPAEIVDEIRSWTLERSGHLWGRMTAQGDDVPLGHDGYLKLWALGRPTLAADYVLLDEAQDTNRVVLGVLRHQQAQIVYVGDRHQQIYEWRGAINAMETIEGCDEAVLTQSFRFGDAIADAATAVLSTLGETHRIRGNSSVESTISAFGTPRAVLARTNATVILEVLDAMSEDLKPCVVGGTKELKRLLSDVYELKAGKPGISPEFFGFAKWSEVVAFSETEEGESIRMYVQLVEQHGVRTLWAAVNAAHDDEASADIIISTAHKAKGREWDSVRLAPDFASSRLGRHPGASSEVRLFYVAMTRARKNLIVAPEVLNIFATHKWRTIEPERRSLRDARSSGRLAQGPGPAHEASPAGVRERQGVRVSVTATATPLPPAAPRPPRRGFWSRIGRLFE